MAEWLGKWMATSPFAPMEDPTEDVFVGCINSEFGSFRILQGIFVDGAFLVERLLSFFSEKLAFPTFQETTDSVLALLRLSDALVSRAHLSRYCVGGGTRATRIQLPRWREQQPRVEDLFFSAQALESLGIDKGALADFYFREEHREKLQHEALWSSSLERHPLLPSDDGLIVLEPSTLGRTAMRFMAERMRVMGGWGEAFYQKENATIFVNEVRAHLNIEWIEFSPPRPREGTPAMFPAFGAFDLGKPVMMLTYTPPLQNAAKEFGGTDRLTSEEEQSLNDFIQACAAELEKMPGFSGGLVLICIASYGRAAAMAITRWSPQWQVRIATLRDWLSITAHGRCTAMRLWKLGEHEAARMQYGIELANPAGFPNLFAWWKQSGFRAVPREVNIHHPRNLLALECDSAKTMRAQAVQERDEHCIRSHDGSRWVRIVRHHSRALFAEDGNAPVYGDIEAAANKHLIGCTLRGRITWWVQAPKFSERQDLRDLLYQLWDCILQWTDRFVLIAEREWSAIPGSSIEVRIMLPGFRRWRHGRGGKRMRANVELSIAAEPSSRSFSITIPEGFLNHFNVPENVGEQKIIAALFEGTAALHGENPAAERIQELVREVIRNEDARYFHLVETDEIEQLLAYPGRPHPLFITEEDTMLAELGLADLAGRPRDDDRYVGRTECREFLQDTVTRLWERLEKRLRQFDRETVVSACFRAIDEVSRDEAHWDLSTRSLLALHDDDQNTKRVLRDRRSQRSAANQANRLIIETAQYACAVENGRPFTMADHLTLLAEMNLLVRIAQHRDAIAFGFTKPEVTIFPNGEIDVDEEFYATVLSRYLSRRSDEATQRAAERYDQYFERPSRASVEESASFDERLTKLDEVFVPEFGFSIQKLFKLVNVFRGFAVRSKTAAGYLAEPEMMVLLVRGCDFTRTEAQAFLDRFTLPIRSAWDSDLPPRCKLEDVYPWRFRRHLSLLMRPVVQIGLHPRVWLVSATFFEKSCEYVIGNIEHAVFPERFFASEQMRMFIGRVVNHRGHSFAEKVCRAFNQLGFKTRFEIELTELGAPKKEGLGDIDVLAWDAQSGYVFPVECKRLLPALTVREVIQRLEEFRGDKKAKDSLAKHLRRIDWLTHQPDHLAKLTGIAADRTQLKPMLVTSEIVPMQFYNEMAFPTDQVISFDELSNYLSDVMRSVR